MVFSSRGSLVHHILEDMKTMTRTPVRLGQGFKGNEGYL
ncbi:Transketolase [Bacillus sp. IT-79MI2]|nr:hypothetical protein BTH41_04781 [Bacillus mycoides]